MNSFISDAEKFLQRNVKASGIDLDALTPSTPARARARRAATQSTMVAEERIGENDGNAGMHYDIDSSRAERVGGGNTNTREGKTVEKWESQLDKYFGDDGVGVKRYTIIASVRGWKPR